VAAGTRVDRAFKAHGPGLCLAASAAAWKGVSAERFQRSFVCFVAIALVEDRAVPMEGKPLQRTQDAAGRTGSGTLRVQILHAQVPARVVAAGLEETGDARQEGTKMQCARR